MTRATIERATPGDLMQLAVDGCPMPWHAGAILTLEGTPDVDRNELGRVLGRRLGSVPRLRQLLHRGPCGSGRPVWVDAPAFDARRHAAVVPCPPPGDERSLLDLAAGLMARPLTRLWSVTLVTGLAGGRSALVLVFHHVLTDGIGGLAVLAGLVDGAPVAPAPTARPWPGWRELALDAAGRRLRAAARLPHALRRLRDGLAELRTGRLPRAERSSLNRPTGPRRRFAVVRTDLDSLQAVTRAHGGTVNDGVLTAVTAALAGLLARRAEHVTRLVVSVIVSGHSTGRPAAAGNAVGAIPVPVPVGGDRSHRLAAVAATMRERKRAARGASAALLEPAFRVLGATRTLHPLLDRQRMINTVLSNVRGPDQPLSLLGVGIGDVVALPTTAGNLTVGFAVLSYAGVLEVTMAADPGTCPDLDLLATLLRRELDALRALAGAAPAEA